MSWSLRPAILSENPVYFDRTYRPNRYLGRSVSRRLEQLYEHLRPDIGLSNGRRRE